MIAIRFALLGPVEVSAAGRHVATLAPRHRAVLAYLLLNTGIVVSAERLIEAMWGLTPPGSARSQIQASLAAVRRALREAGAGDVVLTRPGGYLIPPESGALDVAEFDGATASARTMPAQEAVPRLRFALRLWRGEPLADLDADFVPSARVRLAKRRLAAVEQLMDLELSLGGHAAVLEELAGEVERHPTREKLRGQYMLALHRSGRQAEALRSARAYRKRLAEEQGLDPGREFTALEQAILRDEAGLTATAARPAARSVTDYLPYDVPDFAGRVVELERLTAATGRAAASGGAAAALAAPAISAVTAVTAIDGMAGIGKTTLAVRVGHRLAADFPDGRLFVDLHAHTAGREPVDADTALEILLRQLGVPAEQIPATLDCRAARWRAELANRRVLAIVDNALDAAHVRPLLPGATASLVLVTSRRRLLDLDGVRSLSLDVLPVADALALFRGVVGDRADAEPQAVLDVLEQCGFLPLAVRIAAARLHHRPQWSVAHLAERLRGERGRLAELAIGERGVAAAFSLSYQQLRPDKQRMFRLLGLHPGIDITAEAAAALADLPVDHAEAVLERLLDAHVLLQQVPGRYTMHDLLRTYARTVADADETPENRHSALHRLTDHYLHKVAVASEIMHPDTAHRRRPIPEPAAPVTGFADAAAALAWLNAERGNLLAVGVSAADNGFPRHTIHLSELLWRYISTGAHVDMNDLYRRAATASRLIGDRAGEATARLNLGVTLQRLNLFDEAEEHLARAEVLAAASGNVDTEALAVLGLGRGRRRVRDFVGAEAAGRHALDLFRTRGDRYGEITALTHLALALGPQRRFPEARECLEAALALARAIESPNSIADVLANSGVVMYHEARYEEARERLLLGLEMHRELGRVRGAATCLNHLGLTATALGDPAEAVARHEAALECIGAAGEPLVRGHAHFGLARAHRALGRPDLARRHAEQALALYTAIGGYEADEVRELLGALGDVARA